jgi:hypothetical protein
MLVNPDTAETSSPRYIMSAYTSNFTCSIKCLRKINDFHNEFNNKNVLMRINEIPDVYGFIVDNDILNELRNTTYIARSVVRVLNPQADEFIP